MSDINPNSTYSVLRSVWNSTGDYLNVNDTQANLKLDEIIFMLNQGNLSPYSGITFNATSNISGVVYGTNLPPDFLDSYSSDGTQLYTGDDFILVSNEKKMLLEINGIDDWSGNYIMNTWEPYQFGYEFRNKIDHLVFYSGTTYENITSIYSDRLFDGKPLGHPQSIQNEFRGSLSLTAEDGLKELRIPLKCKNLTSVIIRNEKLSTQSIDSILITLEQIGNYDGYVDLSNSERPSFSCGGTFNYSPSFNGEVAIQKLLQKNWVVKTA